MRAAGGRAEHPRKFRRARPNLAKRDVGFGHKLTAFLERATVGVFGRDRARSNPFGLGGTVSGGGKAAATHHDAEHDLRAVDSRRVGRVQSSAVVARAAPTRAPRGYDLRDDADTRRDRPDVADAATNILVRPAVPTAALVEESG